MAKKKPPRPSAGDEHWAALRSLLESLTWEQSAQLGERAANEFAGAVEAVLKAIDRGHELGATMNVSSFMAALVAKLEEAPNRCEVGQVHELRRHAAEVEPKLVKHKNLSHNKRKLEDYLSTIEQHNQGKGQQAGANALGIKAHAYRQRLRRAFESFPKMFTRPLPKKR